MAVSPRPAYCQPFRLKGDDVSWNRAGGGEIAPESWSNGGGGGIRVRAGAEAATVEAFTGHRSLAAHDRLTFNFSMLATPVKGG